MALELYQWQLRRQKLTNWYNNLATWKKRLLSGVSLVLLGVCYLKVISPTFGVHIPCVFREITGYYCPGCGLTRACLALLDGDIYQAFRYNMLVFILAPLFVVYTIVDKKGLKKYSNILMMVMLILTFIFFVLRNTEVFGWLAPTVINE